MLNNGCTAVVFLEPEIQEKTMLKRKGKDHVRVPVKKNKGISCIFLVVTQINIMLLTLSAEIPIV